MIIQCSKNQRSYHQTKKFIDLNVTNLTSGPTAIKLMM